MAETGNPDKKLDIRIMVGAVLMDVTEIQQGGGGNKHWHEVLNFGTAINYYDSDPVLVSAIQGFWAKVPQMLDDHIRSAK